MTPMCQCATPRIGPSQGYHPEILVCLSCGGPPRPESLSKTPTDKLAAIKAKLEEMEKTHVPYKYFSRTICDGHGAQEPDWPCDAARLLPSVKREVKHLEGCMAAGWTAGIAILYTDLCEEPSR